MPDTITQVANACKVTEKPILSEDPCLSRLLALLSTAQTGFLILEPPQISLA